MISLPFIKAPQTLCQAWVVVGALPPSGNPPLPPEHLSCEEQHCCSHSKQKHHAQSPLRNVLLRHGILYITDVQVIKLKPRDTMILWDIKGSGLGKKYFSSILMGDAGITGTFALSKRYSGSI